MLPDLTGTIVEWESKGLSNKKNRSAITGNHNFYTKKCSKFIFFIVYELDRWLQDLNAEITLKDCLFGAAKLTINTDPDKYSYLRYGIGLNLVHFFHFQILIGVKMLLFVEQAIVHQFILIIRKRYLSPR